MASIVSHEQAPSMLNRIDRLDVMLGYLEQMHSGRKSGARSPATSTNSSGLLTVSDLNTGGDSSATSSPKILSRRRCRSMQEAMVEIQEKGTLFDRIEFLENRILKLEDEIEMERKESDGWGSPKASPRGLKRESDGLRSPKASPGKGLKRLVKSCVKGGSTKTKE
ncbi:Lethal factor [Rhynchospora pubera]|uniref:Lethal factor n=1 Tax=Rhynchospora pubera TaxID=906938 RepID=A0AAV8FDL2_9POAL|nr:Lethal factor [Rhynchospora pubera]